MTNPKGCTIENLAQAQGYEKTGEFGNIMRLTDTTISAFLNGSDAELSLLGNSYLMAKNNPDTMEEALTEYESSFVENNDTVLAASITLESGESYYYPQDYAPANPQEENWYIEAVDYDGVARFSTLHELSDGKLAFTASKTTIPALLTKTATFCLTPSATN